MDTHKVGLVMGVVPMLLLLLMWPSYTVEDQLDHRQDQKKDLVSHQSSPTLTAGPLLQEEMEERVIRGLRQDDSSKDMVDNSQTYPALTPGGGRPVDQQAIVADDNGFWDTPGADGEDNQKITADNLLYQNSREAGIRTEKSSTSSETFQFKSPSVITSVVRRTRNLRMGDVTNADQYSRIDQVEKTDPARQTSVNPRLPTSEVVPASSTTLEPLYHHSQHQEDEEEDTSATTILARVLVNLCDHPPHTFSPTFKGQSVETCYGRSFFPVFDIENLCHMMYKLTEDDVMGFYTLGSVANESGYNKSPDYHVYTGRFVVICAILYKRFNKCIENNFLTACADTGVMFINPSTCPFVESTIDVTRLYSSYFFESAECIADICTGASQIIENVENEIPVYFIFLTVNCLEIVLPNQMVRNQSKFFTNFQWPSCYPFYTVMWLEDPVVHGLHWGWSYLPSNCVTVEVLLVVMVACVAVSGVVGNLMVVVVMRTGKYGGGESNRLRTSLAVADLSNAVFVVCPSLYYHLLNILSTPDYRRVMPETYPHESDFAVTGSFTLFNALLYTVCSFISIQTLFLLSIERVIVTSRAIKYRHYITVPIVNVTIGFTWTMALLNTLLFAFSGENVIQGGWDMFSKLPAGISYQKRISFHWIMVMIHSTLLILICFTTILCSVLAIVGFVCEQARVRAEWKDLKLNYSGPMKKENRHIMITQVLITLFFLLSVIPYFTLHIIIWAGVDVGYPMLLHYIGRWSYLASVAWNPWIYNTRSRVFQEDMALTWQRLLRRAKELHGMS